MSFYGTGTLTGPFLNSALRIKQIKPCTSLQLALSELKTHEISGIFKIFALSLDDNSTVLTESIALLKLDPLPIKPCFN